jgi:hypothetical protein
VLQVCTLHILDYLKKLLEGSRVSGESNSWPNESSSNGFMGEFLVGGQMFRMDDTSPGDGVSVQE